MNGGATAGKRGEETLPIGKKIDSRDNVSKAPHDYNELPEEVRRFLVEKKRKDTGERNTLQKLEGKHMLTMIVYLSRMSPVLKSDIYNDVARSAGIAAKLEDLRDMGIIEIYCTGRTNNNVIVMTEKGRKVARKLEALISLIESDSE